MKLRDLLEKRLSPEEREFGIDAETVDDYSTDDPDFGNPSIGEKAHLTANAIKHRRKMDDTIKRMADKGYYNKKVKPADRKDIKAKIDMEKVEVAIKYLRKNLDKKNINIKELLKNISVIEKLYLAQKFDFPAYFQAKINTSLKRISSTLRKVNKSILNDEIDISRKDEQILIKTEKKFRGR